MKVSYRGKRRDGARAVDLGRPKFEINHKSHCFQGVSSLIGGAKHVDWGGYTPLGAGPGGKSIKLENL